MKYEKWIMRSPDVCGGVPVMAGTRVPLSTVLASLAEGASFEEILTDFPTLREEHLRAAVVFAATAAGEDMPIPSVPLAA